MFPVICEESKPHERFESREAAEAVAKSITAKPRSGVARAQFVGAWNCWIVEVVPRSNPYSNPAVLRYDGTIAKYN